MAFFEMKYHSDTLKMGVSLNVILPEKAKTMIGMNGAQSTSYKTLYLLHGLSDDHSIWMRRTSIERYAAEYGIAVVMPSVGRSWYIDTAYGVNYFTFVTEELPRVCRSYFRGMSDRREDNFIAGLSMGGYGAVKAAMTYPEVFGGCASLSGALDFTTRDRPNLNTDIKWIFGEACNSSAELAGTKHDVYYLTGKAAEEKITFPKMYLWCGLDDALIEGNRKYSALLDELGVEHVYEESEGNHSWKWWDLHIQDALRYLLG
ncbi:MAG: esterase family protein [Clostridia bacterium]|nr:esterase family protein [Clostridia bacterium]